MKVQVRRKALAVSISMTVLGAAHAAPLATLDRNGAWVSVEAYGPNVVRVTIATDKAEALKGPGYGILPQSWMGRRIAPIESWAGCDVDYLWQLPAVEFWLREHGFEPADDLVLEEDDGLVR